MKYATLKKYMKMYHRNEISRIKLVSAIAKYQAELVDEKMMDTVGLAVSKSRKAI